jgi:tRNA(adenine34) deaminase
MIEADHRYLRYALMVAERARDHGDRPFGAVLVSNRGRILIEAENAKHATHDCTSHAETRLLAQASRQFPRHLLGHCTLYVNAEPCPMCAGAIFWSGVGRVVFGLSNARLRQLVGPAFGATIRTLRRGAGQRHAPRRSGGTTVRRRGGSGV